MIEREGEHVTPTPTIAHDTPVIALKNHALLSDARETCWENADECNEVQLQVGTFVLELFGHDV